MPHRAPVNQRSRTSSNQPVPSPSPPSSEEGYALRALYRRHRPHQDETYVGGGVPQPLPGEPLIRQMAARAYYLRARAQCMQAILTNDSSPRPNSLRYSTAAIVFDRVRVELKVNRITESETGNGSFSQGILSKIIKLSSICP